MDPMQMGLSAVDHPDTGLEGENIEESDAPLRLLLPLLSRMSFIMALMGCTWILSLTRRNFTLTITHHRNAKVTYGQKLEVVIRLRWAHHSKCTQVTGCSPMWVAVLVVLAIVSTWHRHAL